MADELLSYRVGLEACATCKKFFGFGTYRRPECYGLITERKEAGPVLGGR